MYAAILFSPEKYLNLFKCLPIFSSQSILHAATRLIFLKHSTYPAFSIERYFVSVHYILKSIFLNQVFILQSCIPLFLSCTIYSNQINVQTLNCPAFQPLFMLFLLSPYIQILSHSERLSSNGPIALKPFLIPIFIIRPLCALSIFREKYISIHFKYMILQDME